VRSARGHFYVSDSRPDGFHPPPHSLTKQVLIELYPAQRQ
jgi:hypothetical protein